MNTEEIRAMVEIGSVAARHAGTVSCIQRVVSIATEVMATEAAQGEAA